MNEISAWDNFFRTGKVEDYIKYSQMKNRQITSFANGESGYAAQNAGINNKTADGRRERPFGNSFNG